MFLLNGGDVFFLKQNVRCTTLTMVEHYLHIAAQTAAVRSQGFSPLDHLEAEGDRQFSHPFNGDTQGAKKIRIYPNTGRRRR